MSCYHPITAWYSKLVNPSGKRSLVFNPKEALQPDDPVDIPCSRCIGCRLERSRQWAIRCIHEASLYENNCFVTLTFSPEYLSSRTNPWSLDVRDWQLFIKRLRKRFGEGIRFFHCGEYGDINKRPHYHACIFNFDFHDKVLWKVTNGCHIYISDSLSELWPYGFSTIGSVTFESAAYVARYIMKKISGDNADEHYTWIEEETGEVYPRKPEYITMSRRPGIGKDWFTKYLKDVYPGDFVVVNGKKCKPPKYYDKLLEEEQPFVFDSVKQDREIGAIKLAHDNTSDRLLVKEQVRQSRINNLVRNL